MQMKYGGICMESCANKNIEAAILPIIRDLSGISVTVWERGEEPSPAGDACLTDAKLRQMLEKEIEAHPLPVIFFENEFVFFGLLQASESVICLGPATRSTMTSAYSAQYSVSHGIREAKALKQCDTGTMAKYLALLACVVLGRPVRYEEITLCGQGYSIASWQREGDMEHYQLAQAENDREHHGGIRFENEMLEIVKRGDTEAIKRLLGGQMPDMDEIGAVAKSEQKQTEYLVVSLLTLLTRAAIAGGVNSEKALEMGDVFLRQLEASSNRGGGFAMIGYRAMFDFTELVKQAREQKQRQSTIVEACKDYIAKNLRKNLEVAQIAPAISVSRTHLAHKFKEVEGITVQQYIQRERCRHAANLLQYSDYPISIIAEYMCFSSQSYFGSCFKQWYGMTPNEYRLQNQKL